MTRRAAAFLAGLVLAAGASVAGIARQQTFAVAVDGVAVDVAVTRDRRPVKGLTAADFRLRDNGVPQRIESVMIEDVPITVLLVLDVSESVKGAMLTRLQSAATAAADALRPDDRIGLMTFADRVETVVAPPAGPKAMAAPLASLAAGGATTLYDAAFAAVALRPRIPGRTVVLVFSDGDDTASWLDPLDVIKAARRSDVVVHAVARKRAFQYASGEDARTRRVERDRFEAQPQLFGRLFLSQLAEETGGSLFIADSTGLPQAFAQVVNEFRSRYLLTYEPTGVAARGFHTIDVALNGHRGEVRARRGYLR